MAKASDKKKSVITVPETKELKAQALKKALSLIRKTYGDGAIMRLGENKAMDIEAIPTGSLLLDIALGVNGLPKGRIIELYGPESSGKTTVALHVIAEAQKLGGEVAFIDVEHALDPVYAKALGVDIDSLLISQPDSGEQALEIAEVLVRSGGIDCLVVDSVAALTTRAEIDGDMGDAHVGQLARLMSQAMRKLTAVVSKTNCVAIFINQIREKIGTVYGNPETTPGGRALKFYSSVRLDVRKGEVIKDDGKIIGAKTKIKVTKNKVAPPFKEVVLDLIYGKGISRSGEILDMAITLDIIHKSGSWFKYEGNNVGQGRDAVLEKFKEDPEFFKTIEEKVMAQKDKVAALIEDPDADLSKFEETSSESTESPSEAAAAAEPGKELVVDTSDEKEDIPEDINDFEEFTPVES